MKRKLRVSRTCANPDEVNALAIRVLRRNPAPRSGLAAQLAATADSASSSRTDSASALARNGLVR